ncbi:MraY family glycosyltransferase [Lentisphaerota bacterium WC36G]|nr:undecaprenyl/decaprenyl-phosphate alpha-N-acetylglucosaminyl 1-phosphate transferase [Lentisphaerae bacterium WC36]
MTINLIFIYIAAFVSATALSLILTPVSIKIALKTNFFDKPQEGTHNLHSQATPFLGGVAMFVSWLLTILVGWLTFWLFKNKMFSAEMLKELVGFNNRHGALIAIILAVGLITIIGLIDDKYKLKASTKLFGQIIASLMVVFLGGVKMIIIFNNPIWVGFTSVMWILVLINAINFLDNMDGLAAGISAIAFFFFVLISAINGQFLIATLAAICCGATVGFWFFNHTPARIFMGDSGSHFLGMLLAVISMATTFYDSNSNLPIYVHFLVPLFVLGVPLFDAVAVMIIRYKLKTPFHIGDHNHLSHRFVRMGLTRKSAVLIIHLLTVLLGLSSLLILCGKIDIAIIAIAQGLMLFAVISILQYCVIKKK